MDIPSITLPKPVTATCVQCGLLSLYQSGTVTVSVLPKGIVVNCPNCGNWFVIPESQLLVGVSGKLDSLNPPK